MTRLSKMFVGLALLSFTTTSSATNLVCIGKVEGVYTSNTGKLAIISLDLFGDAAGRNLCDLDTDENISATQCQNWFSQLLASYASQKNIRIAYNGSQYSSCDQQPEWNGAETPSTVSNWY